jgi:hypothetical protein
MDIQLLLDQFPLKSGKDYYAYWKELLKRYRGANGDIKDVKTPVYDFLTANEYFRNEQGLIDYCIDRRSELKATEQISKVDLEEVLKAKRGEKKKQYRVLIVSDAHGFFMDLAVRDCILRVLKDHYFDEVIFNGDNIDAPYLSSHSIKIRLNESNIFRDYTETKEIEYTSKELFEAFKNTVDKSTKLVCRNGNHCERITDPKGLGREQLLRLQILQNSFGTIDYSQMLRLNEIGVEYDPAPIRMLFDCFTVVHGLALSKNAANKNIAHYASSGASSHTHRGSCLNTSIRGKHLSWFETSCMRLIKAVEYFPTSVIPDWVNGMTEIVFDLSEDSPLVFGKNHLIQKGKTNFNGYIY